MFPITRLLLSCLLHDATTNATDGHQGNSYALTSRRFSAGSEVPMEVVQHDTCNSDPRFLAVSLGWI